MSEGDPRKLGNVRPPAWSAGAVSAHQERSPAGVGVTARTTACGMARVRFTEIIRAIILFMQLGRIGRTWAVTE